MTSPIRLGGGHCCACTVICYHVGPMQLCSGHDQRPVTVSVPGGETELLRTRIAELEAEVHDLRLIFDLGWTRTRQADRAWQAEAPEERANVWPDLGVLITWLMTKAGLPVEVEVEEPETTDNQRGCVDPT